MSTKRWLRFFQVGLSKLSMGVRKRPAYKELLRTLTTSIGTQDGASSLPSEGPSVGLETQPESSEEWTRGWASDLKKAVEESGINLDGLRLNDIEPGVTSDWLREPVDSSYEAWLPQPVQAGRSGANLPGLLQRSLMGLALRGGHSMPGCSGVTTRIVHAVSSRSSRVTGANPRHLSQCLSRSHFGMISLRPPPSLILGRFPLLGSYTGNCCIQLHRRMW